MTTAVQCEVLGETAGDSVKKQGMSGSRSSPKLSPAARCLSPLPLGTWRTMERTSGNGSGELEFEFAHATVRS